MIIIIIMFYFTYYTSSFVSVKFKINQFIHFKNRKKDNKKNIIIIIIINIINKKDKCTSRTKCFFCWSSFSFWKLVSFHLFLHFLCFIWKKRENRKTKIRTYLVVWKNNARIPHCVSVPFLLALIIVFVVSFLVFSSSSEAFECVMRVCSAYLQLCSFIFPFHFSLSLFPPRLPVLLRHFPSLFFDYYHFLFLYMWRLLLLKKKKENPQTNEKREKEKKKEIQDICVAIGRLFHFAQQTEVDETNASRVPLDPAIWQ